MDVYLRIIGIVITILTIVCGTILLVIYETGAVEKLNLRKYEKPDIIILYIIGIFSGALFYTLPEAMEVLHAIALAF